MYKRKIVDIQGTGRVEQAVVAKVDENRKPIPGTEMVFDCDTILLSVGLIPENELTRQAGIKMDPRTNGAVVFENMETSIPEMCIRDSSGCVIRLSLFLPFSMACSQMDILPEIQPVI